MQEVKSRRVVGPAREKWLPYLLKHKYMYLMLVPAVLYYVVFCYLPMFGVTIAFKKFNPMVGIWGSQWVGFKYFEQLFSLNKFYQVFWNTIRISFIRLLFGFPFPIIIALLLNELRRPQLKRAIQTAIYVPQFISWVVLGGILTNLLSADNGVINAVIKVCGGQAVGFLTSDQYFVPTMVVSMIWKTFGWNTIIYLAALTSVDPQLYEAATMDGANRWQQLLHITLPSIMSTIVVVLIMRIGSLMQAGFEQIFVLHCAGTKQLVTPALDSLAREGLRFDSFFCASPVCSPARASLLTGRMPSAHGVHDWLRSGNVDAKKFAAQGADNPYGGYADETEPIAYTAGMPTYTDMLKDAGYACALCGKWHLGDSVHPQHGLDRWYTLGKGGCFYYHPDIVENGDIRVYHGEYVTDLITDHALRELDTLAGGDSPFYLSVHYTAPHAPWSAEQHPKKWIDHYDACDFSDLPDEPDDPDMTTGPVYGTPRRHENLRGYFAAISAMDEGVGKILDKLRLLGILDDTLVIFTADNGMSMGHHGIWGKGNGTFPVNMYDTAVKAPFLLRYPALVKHPGTVCSAMVSACDLYPALAELVGGSVPDGLPGHSFLAALSGESTREAVVIADEYGPVRMLRTREWKYIRRYPFGPDCLFDLVHDPEEKHSCLSNPENAERVTQMRRELEQFFLTYGDPALDGSREGVTGSGQLCRAGLYATRPDVYAPIPRTRKELGDACNDAKGEQP